MEIGMSHHCDFKNFYISFLQRFYIDNFPQLHPIPKKARSTWIEFIDSPALMLMTVNR